MKHWLALLLILFLGTGLLITFNPNYDFITFIVGYAIGHMAYHIILLVEKKKI